MPGVVEPDLPVPLIGGRPGPRYRTTPFLPEPRQALPQSNLNPLARTKAPKSARSGRLY